jgi:hypothetical protein
MSMAWLRDCFVAGACTLAAAGCTTTVTTDSGAPPAGRLVLQWTVEGSTDPNLCAVGGAAAIDITIRTVNGLDVGEFQAPCDDFATTISTLSEGSYTANAVLVGSGNQQRTTEIDVSPFTMTRADLVIPLDFPASSFINQ